MTSVSSVSDAVALGEEGRAGSPRSEKPCRYAARALLAILALLTLSTPAQARTLDGTPVIVQAPAGKLAGRALNGVEGFAGIPYVRPPTGALRWRAPQPAPAWAGVRDAAAFGNDCPQQRLPFDATPSTQPTGEDCLALNIWRPAGARRLPVMVWIHGGGFVMGSSASPVLDGAALARRGVVLVSFNYRLGRFGFFAHPALTAEAGGRPTADFALLDMIAALRWVKANIAAFGGDPAKVTIFGESAGGAAVNLLMASPLARGLFSKAIVESGATRLPYARLSSDRPGQVSAEKAGVAFAASAGLADPDAAALRALTPTAVQGGLGLMDMQPGRFSGPIIDGVAVPADPVDAFAAGHEARVPYLVGTNGAELSLEPFAPLLMASITKQLSAASLADLKTVYGDPPAPALIDHFLFTEPARGFARLTAARGVPTFLYVFDYVAEADRGRRKGAGHASELAYLFGNLPASATPADRATSQLIGDYWTNFAKTGNPNAPGLPPWPRYDTADRLLLIGNDAVAGKAHYAGPRLDAVERVYAAMPR